MCGLVGMVGTLEFKHKHALKEMLFLNTLRGGDSTGLTAVKRDRTVVTRKMTVPGYEFIEHPSVEKMMNLGDQLWMGHGRYKTTGSISKANAHPFEVMDEEDQVLLVGAHNGTLTNKWEVERNLGEKYDTDSEALMNLLVEEDDFKKAVSILKGAWALTFWDATTNSFHMLRNNERPLVYAWAKDHKVLIWASEAWHLINACRRHGVELDCNDKGIACFGVPEDKLLTLEIPQERDQVLPELRVEGGYLGSPSYNFSYKNGWEKFQGWWEHEVPFDEEGEKKAAEAKEKGKTNEKASNVFTLGVPKAPSGNKIRGYKGEELTLEQFKVIKDKGCAWCGDHFKLTDPFAFLTEDNLLCMACIHDLHPKIWTDPVVDEELDDPLPFSMAAN